MTIDEALKVLDTIPTIGEQVDALEMAIGALKQEPCEDAISRQAAEALFRNARKELMKQDRKEHIKDFNTRDLMLLNAEQFIHLLPSVTPQPKVGEWLEKEVNSDKVIEEWQSARCNVCGRYHTTPYMYYFSNYKFCPNCGARMEVEE